MSTIDISRYDAVIFDLDGVLTDTALYHFNAWKKLADRLGIPFDEQDNERLKGVSRAESLDIILEKSERTYSDEEKATFMTQKNDDYKEAIASISPDDLFPGVLPLFSLLKRQGFKTGLASASRNADFVVGKLAITDQLDFIADANRVAHSKPAPDIFLQAAEGLGIAPEKAIGVEDAAAGIVAIHAAGMPAIGIGDPEQLKAAELIYPDVASLLPLFEEVRAHSA